MKPGDLETLLPFLILSGAIVVLVLAIAIKRSRTGVCLLCLVGLGAAFGAVVGQWHRSGRLVTPLLVIDPYARLYLGLVLLASLAVLFISHDYLARQQKAAEEYYVLLLLATLGAMVLVASNHFASFFLGLELLSVSLYGLIAFRRGQASAVEAGLKYLVLAGVSSAFLLFGMALVYAQLGTMEFTQISTRLAGGAASGVLPTLALGLIIVGIGFKLAVVPFHLWTPDVYQGAPAPVTAFVATVSKGAMFALLLRYFTGINVQAHGSLMLVFTIIAIASMVVGNVLALLQDNVKRLLAYSSIAHLGYLLVAFLATGPLAAEAVTYYLAAYFATTLGAFGVVALQSNGERDAESLDDYRGLAWRRPWLAGVFTAALLSLAGIPLTAGFLGKFYILAAGVGSALWQLALVLVGTSGVGLFYYLRVLLTLYQREPVEARAATGVSRAEVVGALALAALTAVLVWLGVFPKPVIALIQTALSHWI